MKLLYKKYHLIILLFCIVFSTTYSYEAFITNNIYQSNDKDYKNNKSHHDFSYDNRSYSHKSSYNKNYLDTYTANEFKDHFTTHSYTENHILNQPCLYMFDEFVQFAQTYSAYKSTIIQLYTELNKLNFLQKAYYIKKGTYCIGLQKRIHFLYLQLSSIKSTHPNNNNIGYIPSDNIHKYINQQALTKFQNQIIEYNALHKTYATHNPSLSQAIEKRLEAYNNINLENNLQYQPQTYLLSDNIKQLLSTHGQDTKRFTTCIGNQLEQVIHQESIDILERIETISHDSFLYDHQESLINFTVAIASYNHEGMTDKATQIADLCWTLLDLGQAVIEGAALGIYSAAQDIINNPIEASISIIASKPLLAYQLSKVIYNVADISITAVSDWNQAKNKWEKYTEPLNNIINAINNKEISLRDSVKGSTSIVIGFYAQNKLLSGLGQLCNTIKQKSINFIQKNPLLKPQEYLATPDGLLLKTTLSANKLKQSEQISALHLKNNINDKIFKTKCIKRLIKQEGLPNKGKLRYVPPKKLHSFDRLPHEKLPGKRIGFIDRFGNLWVKGDSRTKGQPYEWDVQLSKQGIQQVGWMTRDNSHLNVSLDGRVTHK